MLNLRMVLAGCALTVMSAYVVAKLDTKAAADMSFYTPGSPETYAWGETVQVVANWTLPGDPMDPVTITAELKCVSGRLEDADAVNSVIAEGSSTHYLVGPTPADDDILDAFCIIITNSVNSDKEEINDNYFVDPCCLCM